MEVTVKNLNVAHFASDETLCFQATVYIDGKRAFTAKNEGRGGPNMYEPIGPPFMAREASAAVLQRALKWVRAQPKRKMCLGDKIVELDPDLDLFVDDAVEDEIAGKKLKRLLVNIITIERGKVFRYKAKAKQADATRAILKRTEGPIILNDLPFAQALQLYRQAQGHDLDLLAVEMNKEDHADKTSQKDVS